MQVNGDGAIVHIRISPVGRIMIQTQLLLLKDSIIRKWNAPYVDVLFGLLASSFGIGHPGLQYSDMIHPFLFDFYFECTYVGRDSCPWTGTAIGAKNMFSFQCFVGLVFVCLMMDIVLLTGGIR